MNVTDRNSNNALHKGIWLLDKYGVYEMNSWTEVNSADSKLYLVFNNLCITLMSKNTLIEHINTIDENVKMVYRNDSIGIIVTKDGMKMKKLRMKFAGTNIYSGSSMALNCINTLRPYVKIEEIAAVSTGHKKLEQNECTNTDVSLPHLVAELLSTTNISNFYEDYKDLNQQFPMKDIVEACILDPDFPSAVATVHRILSEKLK